MAIFIFSAILVLYFVLQMSSTSDLRLKGDIPLCVNLIYGLLMVCCDYCLVTGETRALPVAIAQLSDLSPLVGCSTAYFLMLTIPVFQHCPIF